MRPRDQALGPRPPAVRRPPGVDHPGGGVEERQATQYHALGGGRTGQRGGGPELPAVDLEARLRGPLGQHVTRPGAPTVGGAQEDEPVRGECGGRRGVEHVTHDVAHVGRRAVHGVEHARPVRRLGGELLIGRDVLDRRGDRHLVHVPGGPGIGRRQQHRVTQLLLGQRVPGLRVEEASTGRAPGGADARDGGGGGHTGRQVGGRPGVPGVMGHVGGTGHPRRSTDAVVGGQETGGHPTAADLRDRSRISGGQDILRPREGCGQLPSRGHRGAGGPGGPGPRRSPRSRAPRRPGRPRPPRTRRPPRMTVHGDRYVDRVPGGPAGRRLPP